MVFGFWNHPVCLCACVLYNYVWRRLENCYIGWIGGGAWAFCKVLAHFQLLHRQSSLPLGSEFSLLMLSSLLSSSGSCLRRTSRLERLVLAAFAFFFTANRTPAMQMKQSPSQVRRTACKTNVHMKRERRVVACCTHCSLAAVTHAESELSGLTSSSIDVAETWCFLRTQTEQLVADCCLTKDFVAVTSVEWSNLCDQFPRQFYAGQKCLYRSCCSNVENLMYFFASS